ncbi:MAG TPA: ACT domain-containing protein [Acidimicrobiia bacterium]|nr:ACT domain-containing protein [Acidimicrobiia bacterium]
MATLVLTAIGDDQAGLVDALSGVIADHGGDWDKSHMAQLAGKFAGIVMVTVSDDKLAALMRDLEPLEGLLDITAGVAADGEAPAPSTRLSMELVGLDHPGIVHDISHALATRSVSIEELSTETSSAPMGGGWKAPAPRRLLQLPR